MLTLQDGTLVTRNAALVALHAGGIAAGSNMTIMINADSKVVDNVPIDCFIQRTLNGGYGP